jgi:hypothetical protein
MSDEQIKDAINFAKQKFQEKLDLSAIAMYIRIMFKEKHGSD